MGKKSRRKKDRSSEKDGNPFTIPTELAAAANINPTKLAEAAAYFNSPEFKAQAKNQRNGKDAMFYYAKSLESKGWLWFTKSPPECGGCTHLLPAHEYPNTKTYASAAEQKLEEEGMQAMYVLYIYIYILYVLLLFGRKKKKSCFCFCFFLFSPTQHHQTHTTIFVCNHHRYWANRMKDEDDGETLNYTNLDFLHRMGSFQDKIHAVNAAHTLADACNHALIGDLNTARRMARVHMCWDAWLRAGKPYVPPTDGLVQLATMTEKSCSLPDWLTSPWTLYNSIETMGEVCKYIDQHLPCACLKQKKKHERKLEKAAHVPTVAKCVYCRKPNAKMKCSLCHGGATYCSKECQIGKCATPQKSVRHAVFFFPALSVAIIYSLLCTHDYAWMHCYLAVYLSALAGTWIDLSNFTRKSRHIRRPSS